MCVSVPSTRISGAAVVDGRRVGAVGDRLTQPSFELPVPLEHDQLVPVENLEVDDLTQVAGVGHFLQMQPHHLFEEPRHLRAGGQRLGVPILTHGELELVAGDGELAHQPHHLERLEEVIETLPVPPPRNLGPKGLELLHKRVVLFG